MFTRKQKLLNFFIFSPLYRNFQNFLQSLEKQKSLAFHFIDRPDTVSKKKKTIFCSHTKTETFKTSFIYLSRKNITQLKNSQSLFSAFQNNFSYTQLTSFCFSSSGRFLYGSQPSFRFLFFFFFRKTYLSFSSILMLFVFSSERSLYLSQTFFKAFLCFFYNIKPAFLYIGKKL